MDPFMYGLDVGVAIILAGLMVAYNFHKGREIHDMRVQKVFDGRRYFTIAIIVTILYAIIAIIGLSISVYFYPPAYWITMILLGAFMIVDFIRVLMRVRSLKKKARQENSVAADVVAVNVRNAGLWMMLYTGLQILNLFYFV